MSVPSDLLGIAEIGQLFGVARNSAWRWTKRSDFPAPTARLASGPVWQRTDVEGWAKDHLPLPTGRPAHKERD
jgi:predicted DNA-binding transcriptional regulator AlpA